MPKNIYIGARDTQTEEQKAKNYQFKEVCTAPFPVSWIEKPKENWKKFPVRNQDGSGTCVAQTYATELSIIFLEKYGVWIDFSASFPYQVRTDPSVMGCNSVDIFDKFPKIGDVFETYMPSQNLNEAQVMAVRREKYFEDLAKVYNIKRIQLPIDFETVASTIQATGKGVMVWFKFHPIEWIDKPFISGNKPTSGHSVTAIDFFLVNGKKYLLILDSWGTNFAIKGYRLISEEYFNARCYMAAYLMNFQVQNNDIIPDRPHFVKDSVSSAKDCLKWEGLFPGNVPSNDIADNIFRSALISYQKRYIIKPTLGNFGPLTNAHLLSIYP